MCDFVAGVWQPDLYGRGPTEDLQGECLRYAAGKPLCRLQPERRLWRVDDQHRKLRNSCAIQLHALSAQYRGSGESRYRGTPVRLVWQSQLLGVLQFVVRPDLWSRRSCPHRGGIRGPGRADRNSGHIGFRYSHDHPKWWRPWAGIPKCVHLLERGYRRQDSPRGAAPRLLLRAGRSSGQYGLASSQSGSHRRERGRGRAIVHRRFPLLLSVRNISREGPDTKRVLQQGRCEWHSRMAESGPGLRNIQRILFAGFSRWGRLLVDSSRVLRPLWRDGDCVPVVGWSDRSLGTAVELHWLDSAEWWGCRPGVHERFGLCRYRGWRPAGFRRGA